MHPFTQARYLVATILAVALTIPMFAIALAAPPQSATGRERVIVVFHDDVGNPRAAANDVIQRHNAELDFVYEHALKGFSAKVPTQAIAAISRDPRVAYVERDQVVQAFEVPTGVDRIEVDKKLGTNSDGTINADYDDRVDIAIIDTGIDHNHPDLNVAGGANCTGGGPFRSSCTTGYPGDDNGHGTHVAGSAAAKDDPTVAGGVDGVAPGADLWAVKVLRADGSGYISWIVAGIDWVTARADTIEVANMSLGCECSSSAMDEAIKKSVAAGVTYVVAAGNSAKDASTFSPANHDDVIAVSAVADFDGLAGGTGDPTCRTDEDDTLANFSNYGSKVDLAAPGVCITSAWPGGGYNTISGTSMASPHGAGAAALYIASSETRPSPSDVKAALQSPTWSVEQTTSDRDGCGFYNDGKPTSERMLMLAACATTSDGGGSTEPGPDTDTTPPDISNVESRKTHHRNGSFEITWTTDEASNSEVTFTKGTTGTYTNADMVTSHRMTFKGSNGVVYEYYVSSTDAAGNKSTSGPHTHQN